MADITSIYGNPIKDAVARQNIATNTQDITDLKSQLNDTQTEALAAYATDTASGSIASFSDGADNIPVKDLVVSIEPVQDLHGQASPYPAGGGKNLFRVNVNSQTLNGVTFSVNSDGTIVANGTASANFALVLNTTSLPSGSYIISKGFASTTLLLNIYDNDAHSNLASVGNTEVTFTSTGQSINVLLYCYSGTNYSNVKIYPMIRLSSVSDATFAPYANICPISGWTGANVGKMGKNLFDGILEDGTIDSNGNNASQSGRYRTKNHIPIKPNQTYKISIDGVAKAVNYWLYDKNKQGITSAGNSTITAPSNAYYLRFYYDSSIYGVDLQLEVGSTASAYEPYNGETISVDWTTEAGTVYGGTLDVTTGVLTVTHTYVDENAFGSVSSGTSAGGLHWVDTTTAVFDADKSSYCSMLQRKNGDAGWGSTSPCYSMGADKKIRIYCNESTTEQFKTAYADLQIVCGLINSTEIQLSANEISTLLGQNNIWSDTGDSTVEYRADTKLYIDKRLS